MTQPETTNPAHPEQPPQQRSGVSLKSIAFLALVAVIILAFFIYRGIRTRATAEHSLQQSAAAESVLPVHVIHPQVTDPSSEIVLPGNMQAYVDTPIWARTTGYLRKWYVDIGGHVKAGQLLADIESPEIDQQLSQAREILRTAQANLKLAQITAERYSNLFKSDSVAKQDVDNAVQTAAARSADVAAAQANVRRLEQLVAFEKVYAPFDGVVTARNIDTGALVDSGSNTPGKELFHLSSNSELRVYISVPETESVAAKPGTAAYLTVAEHPGKRYSGVVVRNANAIDESSRTLLMEVDVKNSNGELLPGSYASVHLAIPGRANSVVIPVNTLLFRSEGLRVAVVRNGKAQLVPISIGHDYGETVEVLTGLHPDDVVIVDPSDSISSGQEVKITQQS